MTLGIKLPAGASKARATVGTVVHRVVSAAAAEGEQPAAAAGRKEAQKDGRHPCQPPRLLQQRPGLELALLPS